MAEYSKAVKLVANAGFTSGPAPKGVLLMPGDSCDIRDFYGVTIGLTSGSGVNAVPFILPLRFVQVGGVTGSPHVLF